MRFHKDVDALLSLQFAGSNVTMPYTEIGTNLFNNICFDLLLWGVVLLFCCFVGLLLCYYVVMLICFFVIFYSLLC